MTEGKDERPTDEAEHKFDKDEATEKKDVQRY